VNRILLIGNTGQVGFELQRLLPALGTVRAVDFPEINLASPDSIRNVIRECAPSLIVNAAAYTAVDKAEAEPELCHAINAAAPGLLAAEAARLGAALVHYSTDFVFDGGKAAPYTEKDTPNPLGVYGRSKLDGDNAIRASGARHLILRTAWVYGRRGRNFLLTLQRLAAEGKPLRIVADQVGCPTWSRVIAGATVSALARLSADLSWEEAGGLYNLVCSGETSWHGFARAFLPATVPVEPITTSQYPTPARRPAYSALDCTAIRKAFGIHLPSWQEALKECLASTP